MRQQMFLNSNEETKRQNWENLRNVIWLSWETYHFSRIVNKKENLFKDI